MKMIPTSWNRSFSAIAQVVLCLLLMKATSAQAAETLYVATNGNNTASYVAMKDPVTPGTYARAMYLAQPDDVIVLKPGIYDSTKLGNTGGVGIMNFYRSRQTVRAQYSAADPSVPLANRSVIKIYDPNVYTAGAANLKFYAAISVSNFNDITIDGFEIDGRFPSNFNGDAAERAPSGIVAQYGASRITISNNIVHDTWGAGISSFPKKNGAGEVVNATTDACDYITITGNVVYNCCYWSRFDVSGISLLYSKPRTSQSDTSFHNYIAFNKVFSNESRYTGLSVYGNDFHTDGNGIIIDSFPANCPYTLIENNICYDNGARGIHVFLSDNVLVRNNTMYKNCQDPDVQDAEFAAVGQNITYTNNIAVGTGYTGINRIGNDAGGVPSTATFSYNLYFNGLPIDGSTLYDLTVYGNGDESGNPKFFNESAKDFRCAYDSPAVNKGNTANYAPRAYINGYNDLFDGIIRPLGGRVDKGAFER